MATLPGSVELLGDQASIPTENGVRRPYARVRTLANSPARATTVSGLDHFPRCGARQCRAGNGDANGVGAEVVVKDAAGTALPTAACIPEVADQFALFGIDADDGQMTALEAAAQLEHRLFTRSASAQCGPSPPRIRPAFRDVMHNLVYRGLALLNVLPGRREQPLHILHACNLQRPAGLRATGSVQSAGALLIRDDAIERVGNQKVTEIRSTGCGGAGCSTIPAWKCAREPAHPPLLRMSRSAGLRAT